MHIQPITPSVGAAVSDIRISEIGVSDAEALRQTLRQYKVLVFKDQDVTSAEYVNFVRTFGDVVQDDLVPQDGHPPELAVLHIRPEQRQTINFWHMDYSFREIPAPYLSLYAKHLPPCGGDTLFTNLEAAYAGLDDATKKRIDTLHAHHKVSETQNAAKRFTTEEFDAMVNDEPVCHPLAPVNPETGQRYLFVNVPIYCRAVAEMPDAEGDALLSSLYAHAQRPEFHFRLRWEANTVVIWENARCLHYPVSDYYPYERLMWRVATRGHQRP
jgi:taurine dioxygenase